MAPPAPLGKLSRRAWLGAAGLVAGSGALVAGATMTPELLARLEERTATWRPGPFGPLRPDPNGVLDLPEGFRYRVLDRAGERMDDGHVVPARPDGMACFSLEGGALALMRNHELPLSALALGPTAGGAPPREAFDPAGAGGVTRIVLDPITLERRSSNVVLAGTAVNCAGGASPWGWLSCEETVQPGHGLVFVCDPSASAVVPARPVPGYGRFRHEAAVVDPASSIAYLTEDREDGCLYRFVPHDPAAPFEGELQALRVRGRPALATGTGLSPRAGVEIDWVPVREPTPDDDVVRAHAVRDGAATIARGEGICRREVAGRTSIVLCASVGGAGGLGQILELTPEGDRGELSVLAASAGVADIEMPDNVTVGPGGRIYFCEDGGGRDHLRGLDPVSGEVFDFARNALSDGELAGVCFSPDGRAMFVNLQIDGMTLAIDGPFA